MLGPEAKSATAVYITRVFTPAACVCVFVGTHGIAQLYVTLFVSVCAELADALVCVRVCAPAPESHP